MMLSRKPGPPVPPRPSPAAVATAMAKSRSSSPVRHGRTVIYKSPSVDKKPELNNKNETTTSSITNVINKNHINNNNDNQQEQLESNHSEVIFVNKNINTKNSNDKNHTNYVTLHKNATNGISSLEKNSSTNQGCFINSNNNKNKNFNSHLPVLNLNEKSCEYSHASGKFISNELTTETDLPIAKPRSHAVNSNSTMNYNENNCHNNNNLNNKINNNNDIKTINSSNQVKNYDDRNIGNADNQCVSSQLPIVYVSSNLNNQRNNNSKKNNYNNTDINNVQIKRKQYLSNNNNNNNHIENDKNENMLNDIVIINSSLKSTKLNENNNDELEFKNNIKNMDLTDKEITSEHNNKNNNRKNSTEIHINNSLIQNENIYKENKNKNENLSLEHRIPVKRIDDKQTIDDDDIRKISKLRLLQRPEPEGGEHTIDFSKENIKTDKKMLPTEKKVAFHELLISELTAMRDNQQKSYDNWQHSSPDKMSLDSSSPNGTQRSRIRTSDWVEVGDNGKEVVFSSCQISLEDSGLEDEERLDDASSGVGDSWDSNRDAVERFDMSLPGLPPLPKSLSGMELTASHHHAVHHLLHQQHQQQHQQMQQQQMQLQQMQHHQMQQQLMQHHNHSNTSTLSSTDSQRGISPMVRKPATLDTQLAILRREMYGLRQLDLSLLSQLWALNESIQEFRSMLQEQETLSPPSPSPSPSDANSVTSGDDDMDLPLEATPMPRMRTAPPPPPPNRKAPSRPV